MADREQAITRAAEVLKLAALAGADAITGVEQMEQRLLYPVQILDLDHPAVAKLVERYPVHSGSTRVRVTPIEYVRALVLPHELVRLQQLPDLGFPCTLAHTHPR